MCFNVNTQYLRRFFSLRFVRACVCSDLDLCHVSELGSRQMGLILCCADRCCRNHLWNQQFDWSLFSQFYTRGFPGDPSKDVKHLRLSWWLFHHHLLCSYVHCWHHRHLNQNQKILGAVCQLPGGAQMSTPWWLCHCHRHCGPTIIIIITTTITLDTTSIVITLWDLYLCQNHPINYHIQKWLKQICAVSLKDGS